MTRLLLAPLLALALLGAPHATASLDAPPAGEHVAAGCNDALDACGSIQSAIEGCVTAGVVLAEGQSLRDDTVWTFTFRSWSLQGPRAPPPQTATGPTAVFHATHGAHLFDGYHFRATLEADGEVVATLSGPDPICI